MRGKLLGLTKKRNVQPIIVWILFLAWERVLKNYRKITGILSILEASSYSHKLKNMAPHVARSVLYGLWIEWQKSETNILKYNRIKWLRFKSKPLFHKHEIYNFWCLAYGLGQWNFFVQDFTKLWHNLKFANLSKLSWSLNGLLN